VAREMHLYPDGSAYYLRKRLAAHLGLPGDHLIFGNGSNEIIEFIGHCFIAPDVSVVVSAHAFVIYKLITRMFGGELIEVPMRGLTHNLTAMARAVRPDTRVLFVCNPNNPTGTMVREAQVRAFMKRVPEDLLVVFDEAYYEITLKKMPDTLAYVRDRRNVLVMRSFSKAYGLAGLRIGYGVAKPEIIRLLEKTRQPFNTSRMAQLVAAAALDDQAFVRRSRKVYRRGVRLLAAFCREAGLVFEPPVANFMLIRTGAGRKVFDELQKLGVIVRPMEAYLLPDWIRVSIGTEAENLKFIAALKKLLAAKIIKPQ